MFMSQEKLQTMSMQKFWGVKEVHYGIVQVVNWKSKHLRWNVHEWKATQPSLRVFSEKLSKWEPCKSCKIPYKPL